MVGWIAFSGEKIRNGSISFHETTAFHVVGRNSRGGNGRFGETPVHTFRADVQSLAIEPGPKPITLTRPELDHLGLNIRDDHTIPLTEAAEHSEPVIDAIISALSEALKRCRGPEETWMAMNLRRAMVLVGGLDEKVAQEILDQEGV